MDIQIHSEIHHLSFFRCIGYKSDFPFLYYDIHVHGLSMTRISDKWLKLVVKNNLVDQFKQTWTSMTENSPKGDNYNLFKHDLKFEDYLDVLDDKDKFLLVKFAVFIGADSLERS
jgi:hypothetical protein